MAKSGAVPIRSRTGCAGWECILAMDLPGNFRYGAEQVNITADRVSFTGLGTFDRDDSGIPAQATDIIIIGSGQPVGYPA